jgi:hypothetical protein
MAKITVLIEEGKVTMVRVFLSICISKYETTT